MKRNLVPLLGIAFVVALAASGIFYGVFVSQLKRASEKAVVQQVVVAGKSLENGTVLKAADLKVAPWAGALPPGSLRDTSEAVGKTLYSAVQENEPVTLARLSSETGWRGVGLRKGMRAISVHVSDSGGLLPLLRSGNHVDLQAVQNRNTPLASLRTILQNVEVLGVQPLPEGPVNQAASFVVTLVMSPENADRVALADSGASLRLLLRNPADDEQGQRSGILLSTLFHSPEAVPQSAQSAIKPIIEESVDLVIKVDAASTKALEEMRAALPALAPGGALEVSAVPSGSTGERLLTSLERNADLLTSARLRASNLRPAYLRAGKQWQSAPGGLCGLSIRFEPRIGPKPRIRLRMEPSLTLPSSQWSTSTRKVVTDLDLSDGQSAIVSGLADAQVMPALASQLFGKPSMPGNNLIVVVTTRHSHPE